MRGVAAVGLVAFFALAGCLGGLGGSVVPHDYLTADKYATWTIEVDYASGHEPSQGLLKFLHDRLAPLVHKDTVEFRLGESLPADATSWSDAAVRAFATQHQNVKTGSGTVALHLLFLTGHSDHDNGNAKVLGVTYGHDLIVIFSDSVQSSCDSALPLPGMCSPDPFFKAVLMHEFGHAIGLVDNGVSMVRNHEATTCDNQPDSHHSSNQQSVMYCQVESSSIVPLFGNNPPTDYDADDKADLKAAGGK